MKRVSLIVFCLLIVSMASITAQKYEVSVKKYGIMALTVHLLR